MALDIATQQQEDNTRQIFELSGVASFTVGGVKLYFPVVSIRERSGKRLAKRARPYRNGVKIDSVGARETTWTVEAVFENSIDEPDIPKSPALFPDVVDALCAAKDSGDTEDLELPLRGKIRAQLEDYERFETAEERDTARVTFTFVQDNEESIDAGSFSSVMHGTMVSASDAAMESLQGLGSFSEMMDQIDELCADIEAVIAAPGEFVQDIDQAAARLVHLIDRLESQFSRTGTLGRDLLTQPDAWDTVRQLRILKDKTARAISEKASQRGPRVVSRRYPTERSLFDIAVDEGQKSSELLAMNPNLDPYSVPANTPVRVWE